MIKRVLADANPGYMVFPSSQSVKMFFEEEQIEELFSPDYLKSVNVICMGDQTERAAKFYGVKPDGKPETPSKQALIDMILKFELKK